MNRCDLLAIIQIGSTIAIALTIVVPRLPLELLRRDIDPSITGFIFSAFALPWLFTPLVMPTSCLLKIGRRGSLQLGLIIQGTALIIYGASRYLPLDGKSLFIGASVVTRFIEGMGAAMTYKVFIPLISQIYTESRARALSARSCGSQLGKSLGYLCGGVAFTLLGYVGDFLFMGVVTMVCALVAFRFKTKQPTDLSSSTLIEQNEYTEIQVKDFMREKRIFLAFMNMGLLETIIRGFEPILAIRLKMAFDFTPFEASLGFSAFLVSNLIGSSLCLVLPRNLKKRKMILVTTFILVFGLLLAGPTMLLCLPNEPAILLLGLSVTGFCIGVSKTLSLVQAVEAGIQKFPEQSHSVSHTASKIYVVQMGLDFLIAPSLISQLQKVIGFRRVTDVLAFVAFMFYLLLFGLTMSDLRAERQGFIAVKLEEEAEQTQEPLVRGNERNRFV